ncbi:hypothetical protein A4X13_0g6140 [Tilletia indica]|uniref:Reverse transcriptase n=1 Tax=Tilletia indica TaxID=43049 RepID=A0A8T8SPK8_9BASI|nr:hypothetical protein A4X13_0g6140 [Tilletia indica]
MLTLDGEPHPSVVALPRAHKDAFALDGRPGRIEDHDMPITLVPDAVLPPEPPRRASPEKRAAMDAAIEQLLDWDVIEPSQSPTSFPVVMVKQNGKWRFCVDYRQLNAKTVPDRYPLPTIDAIFQTLTGKTWFSSLDAIRGYHQLGVEPDDRWKTAFVCRRGLYQNKRVPFGLRNAPAIFQRLMDKVLGRLRWQQAVVYIDDSVIAADTLEEHNAALQTLLENATAVGLKFSPAKCTFAVPSLTLLGRKVSGAGVAIWADGLRQSKKAAPLTRLLKGWRYESADGQTRLVNTEGKAVSAGRVPLSWGSEQQDSFESLRAAVANPPVLAHPDPSRPYILYTDASKNALAAILHQVSTASAPAPVSASNASLNSQYAHCASSSDGVRSGALDRLVARGQTLRTYFAPSNDISDVLRRMGAPGRGANPPRRQPDCFACRWSSCGNATADTCMTMVAILASGKPAPKTGVLDVSNDPSLPFEYISLDILYGFPRSRSGNDAVVAIQDLFSRLIILEPCHKDITAEGVAAIVSARVLRMGWRPRRLVSDSEARVSGAVMLALCASLGAVSTPSSPYHQQANSVERAVQTVQSVLQVMFLDSKSHWDTRLLPSVELAMNSSPSVVTGHRPFDLIFISHPTIVHAVFDDDEHLGVGSFPERLSAAKEPLAEACVHIKKARLDQKRQNDQRRAQPRLIVPGMRAWIRLKDGPITGTVSTKLDARKSGPFPITEVLSPHRVRLALPDGIIVDPVFSIEQLDVEPSEDDPFAADRAPPAPAIRLVSPSSGLDDDAPVLGSAGDDDAVAASGPDPLLPRQPSSPVRRSPTALTDFQLGVLRSAPSPALQDLLHGPLSRPRTIQEGDELLTLTERPVAFLSRLTSPAESKLVAPELELVCLAWAFQKLAHLLEGATTTVVTDHSPMEQMLRSTGTVAYGPTITRCRAILMPHLPNLRFLYRSGARHTNADALSRLPISE